MAHVGQVWDALYYWWPGCKLRKASVFCKFKGNISECTPAAVSQSPRWVNPEAEMCVKVKMEWLRICTVMVEVMEMLKRVFPVASINSMDPRGRSILIFIIISGRCRSAHLHVPSPANLWPPIPRQGMIMTFKMLPFTSPLFPPMHMSTYFRSKTTSSHFSDEWGRSYLM